MKGFREVLRRIVSAGIHGELWINGSFLTEQIDAPDVDFFAIIPAHFYDSGTDEQLAVLEWLISKENEPKRKLRCDTDVCFVYPEGSGDQYLSDQVLAGWRRDFGHARKSGEPKGIAVLKLEEIRL